MGLFEVVNYHFFYARTYLLVNKFKHGITLEMNFSNLVYIYMLNKTDFNERQ
jgi:hypothetical protein